MNFTNELRRPRGRLSSTMNLSSVMVKLCNTGYGEQRKLLKLEQWHPSLGLLLLFLFTGKHFALFFLQLTCHFWAGIFVLCDLNIASYEWVFGFETIGFAIVLFPCALSFFQNVFLFSFFLFLFLFLIQVLYNICFKELSAFSRLP